MSRTLPCLMLTLALSPLAGAHVSYTDLSNPAVSPGGVNGGSFGNTGWFDGTTPTLSDSHRLAGGTFFSFHLDQTSRVSITFSDAFNTGLLNPAFSVYRGILPDDAHDDAAFDPLNPSHLVLTPTPHVVKDPSPVDNGVTADGFGRVSPFRDTANITFVGQFDALHTWSMANESGDWAVILYVAHAPPLGGNSVSLTNVLLVAGDYTIAAGGGTDCGGNVNCFISNIDGTVSFSAVPDADGDGIADNLDNCRLVANNDPGTVPHTASIPRAQFDADHDGYGNICDADINQSNGTTTGDYTLLRNVLNHFDDETAATCSGLCVPGNIIKSDLNGSGQVTTSDYTLLRNRLGTAPGVSGLACAGTIPCP